MNALDDAVQQFERGEIGVAAMPALLRQLAQQRACAAAALEPELLEAARRAGLDDDHCRALVQALRTAEGDDAATVVRPAVDGGAAEQPTQLAAGGAKDDQATRIAAPAATADTDTDTDAPTHVASAGADSGPDVRAGHVGPAGATRDKPLGPGTTIKDRFVLEELIGHGGMGSVYRARDLRREEAADKESEVAIKLINEDFQRHPDAVVALQREAKKAQTLAHPNIVTVYDFDREGATVFISMAYLRGEPLDRVIAQHGALGMPLREASTIIEQMARGLAYAHEKGYAHADFKPGNVFLTQQGDVRILDFGIARAVVNPDVHNTAGDDDHTRFDPATLGAITPAYASVEMLTGEAPVPADDVYALACIAYELLTGRHPFVDNQGRKLPASDAADAGLQPAPLKRVPRRIRRTIRRGLAFRRTDRFADAGAFLQAFRPPARVRRSVLAGLLVLAIVAGGSWWITYEKSDISISMEDLSPAMKPATDLIVYGDQYLQGGKFVQAQKAYAQAWDTGRSMPNMGAEQQAHLKVIVDRRVNKVIGHFLEKAQRKDLSPFALGVLRLNLEFLERSDLGTRDTQIDTALARIDQRLQTQPQAASP